MRRQSRFLPYGATPTLFDIICNCALSQEGIFTMSKQSFSPEIEAALNDFWFPDDYVVLNGRKVLKSEFDAATTEFWNNSPDGTTRLEQSISEEIRQFLSAKLGISPNDQIIISWAGGSSKITLEVGHLAILTRLEAAYIPASDGHYTEAEWLKAQSDFWK